MNTLNIGQVVSEKRKEKGITQEDLAAYIGVTKASVSKWETGQSFPDIAFLPVLAAYFNISVDTLLGYTPQMTKEDIKKTYLKLANDFATKPFDDVYRVCEKIIKKYYSCFPLLVQMCVLLLNHYYLAENKETQNRVIQSIINMCQRIRSESDEGNAIRQATMVEAYCESILGNPLGTLKLLGETIHPYMGEDILLSSAYQMLGNPEKAKLMLQVSMYQNLTGLVGLAANYLSLQMDSPMDFDIIYARFAALIETFCLNKVVLNGAAVFYLTAAQGYALQQKKDLCLSALEHYAEIAAEVSYPIKLQGDDFFNRIDEWIENTLDLGSNVPRDEKAIRESFVMSIEGNPVFEPLRKDIRYINLMQKVKK